MIKYKLMIKSKSNFSVKILAIVFMLILLVLPLRAYAAFRLLMSATPASSISDLEVSDFDKDGVGEVITSGPDRRIYLYENNGMLVYTSSQVQGTLFTQLLSAPPQLGSGDFGLLITDTRIASFNLPQRNVNPVWTVTVQAGWVYQAPSDTGDLNGDAITDLARGRYRSATNALRVAVINTLNGATIAETGNLSGNLDALIFERIQSLTYESLIFSSTAPRFYIYNYNPGTGGISQAASVALPQRYSFLKVVSDVNGDAVKEIACATNIAAGNNGIDLRSGSNGALLSQLRITGAAVPTSVDIADFDKDGIFEVVVGTGGTDRKIRVFKARNPITMVYESGAFTNQVYVRTGDFDFDGSSDIAYLSGSQIGLIKYDQQNGSFYVSETSQAVNGQVDLNEKFKVKQFNGGAAEDIIWANATNSELKAATFYQPPKPVIHVYNEKVINNEVSSGENYLLDRIYFTGNYDGILNSIRFSYSGNLPPQYITALKLFKDNGDKRFDPKIDLLIGQATINSSTAVFNPNLSFVSDAVNLLYLVGDFRADLPAGYSFKLSISQPSDFYAQTFETTGTFPIESAEFLTVDRTIPLVFIQLSKPNPDGANGWYRSVPYIALSTNKLGVIYYKWNNDPEFKVYNGQLSPPAGSNTLYCYAVDLYGNRSTTKSVSLKVDITPPEKVEGVQVEQTGDSKVTVVWRPSLDKAPGSGVSRYEIFRNGTLIGNVSSSQTSFEDNAVKPLTTYRYAVRAVDFAGNTGVLSDEVALKTKPASVSLQGLKVVEEATGNVILWNPVSSGNVAWVDIYRSTKGAAKGFVKVNNVNVDPLEGMYVDEVPEPGYYYYLLKLYNSSGDLVFTSKPFGADFVNIEKNIGQAGGEVRGVSGKVKLEIPLNALLNDTTISINSTATTVPPNVLGLSELYEFKPHGLTFSKPATLTISFKTNRQIEKNLIRLGYFDGSNWNFVVPDVVDTTGGVVKTRIDHFSIFGVFYLSLSLDLEPPKIESVKGASPSKVFVKFNELIDESSVRTALVEVDESTVTTYYPFKDGKTMVVETRYLDPAIEHYIYISGIKDLAGNAVVEDGISNAATFTVSPSPHGKYLDDTNKCSLCHSVHYGKNEQLLVKKNAKEVCYLCHDKTGSGSKYKTQAIFEDPDTTSVHHTRYGNPEIYCTDCHSPHRDAQERPSLLRLSAVSTNTTGSVPEQFCFQCHGASTSTLPAHLLIKEASYTAGIHFKTLPGPSSGNGITCLQCHLPHASVQPSLMQGGLEESACVSCHKENGVSIESGVPIEAPDVLSSLLTAPDATTTLPGFPEGRVIWYKHPVIEYYGRHSLLELFDATLAAQAQSTTETRHAECEDCHNSHYAKQTIYREPPYAPDSLLGAPGVRVYYPDETTVPVYVWEPYGSVTYEYEVCLRCHSGFAKAWAGDDLARLFSPYNTSYHPVISVGKNQTSAINNSLIGLTSNSQILCSDCHFAGDSSYPKGPHGSIYPFILSANYRFELKPQSTTDDYDSDDFELCFKCHSEEPFKDASGAARADTNFRFHGFHLRALYNNPAGNTVDGGILTPGAGKGNAICRECHYNQHGSKNPRLVKFSPNVLPTGRRTQPVFVPKAENQNGYCLLRCHGRNHGAGMDY